MSDWFGGGGDGLRSILRRTMIEKVDDSGSQQLLDLAGLRSEQLKKIVRVMDHGFASNPPKGAEGIILQLSSRSDRSLFFGSEHKDYRQKDLPAGTAVLYDDKGNVIFAKGNNGITVKAKKGDVTVEPENAKNVYLGGDGQTGTYAKVETVSGPAMNVYARIA